MLCALALAAATAMFAGSAAAAASPSATVRVSRAAATPAERLLLGPELLGKVTRAGKVGRIDAAVGDLVVREVQVPGGAGARSALGAAAIQAATVLHGTATLTLDSSPGRKYRIVVAVQENQSKQVRAYMKGHLFSTSTGSLIGTFHRLEVLNAENSDYDSAGDGCGPYPSGRSCLYQKNPGNCEGSAGPCNDYYALGTYRHKCGQAGWGCDNTWNTVGFNWQWWDGNAQSQGQYGVWLDAPFYQCSYNWNVLRGQGDLEC